MKKIYLILFPFLGLHLLILSQLQFTAWPEMISFPYLINHGFITYKDMIHAYPPLLINILAVLYKIFGINIQVLKIFTWASFIANDLLIFTILFKLVKKQNLAIFGVFIYIILQPILEGNMIWPDLFIIPFLLLTTLFLLNKKYFFAGLAIGLAFLTKQTAIFYLITSSIYIFIFERKSQNIFKFILGIMIIILPFLLSLFFQNSFQQFLNWAVIYPSKYWTKFPGYVQLSPTLRENLILLILFFPLSFLLLKSKKKIFSDKYFLLLFGFLICGIIGVYPRFSFFHFQSALSFLIIIYIYLFKNFKQKYIYLFLAIPALVLLINFKSLQFGKTRFWTKNDLNLGQTIQNESSKDKPIYLLGLNSSLYAFANRLPNSPWLDNFGWYLEIPGVQEEVVKSFEKTPPSTIFWQTPEKRNWYDIGTYQPKMITNWIEKNYTREKEIEKGIWEWTRKS